MEKVLEFQTLDDDGVHHRGGGSLSEAKPVSFDRDSYELARVGKEQVLKVSALLHHKRHGLTIPASLWVGEHDRIVLRAYVHLGEHISV
jgi:hypothetical protein